MKMRRPAWLSGQPSPFPQQGMSKAKPDDPKKKKRRERPPVKRRGSAWPAILAASALPLLGGLLVFILVATGKAQFDDSFFFGNLARFVVGGLCIGIVLSVLWARITRGDKLNWFQRVNVPIIVVLVSLFGFYFCAPDRYTQPVTAFFKDVGGWILDTTSDAPADDDADGDSNADTAPPAETTPSPGSD